MTGRPVLFPLLMLMTILPVLGPADALADGTGGSPDRGEPAEAMRLAPAVFRAAVQKVLPSLVTIETYGTSTMPVGRSHRRAITGFSRPGEGPTTGLICSADGYVLTSTFNFARKPKIITVVCGDGSQYVARLVGQDLTRRIALLKIQPDRPLPVPRWAARRDLRIGQWAISVGVGYGADRPAISVGMLSALQRISGKAVQTDANISPANYGGPLVDLEGRVIGLCTPLAPGSEDVMAGAQWYDSGIGFAIPIDDLGPILERLKQGQTIRRGLLGVVLAPAPDQDGGVVVQRLVPHGPAQQAGVKTGDRLKTIQGRPVFDMVDLRTELGRYHAGDPVVVGLVRKGKAMDVKITLQAGPFTSRPDDRDDQHAAPSPGDESDRPSSKQDDKPQPPKPTGTAGGGNGAPSDSPGSPDRPGRGGAGQGR